MSSKFNRWNYNLFVRPGRRIVSWFSNGAASFVATLAAIEKYGDIEIVNCDPGREHPDNKRFLQDAQDVFHRKIKVLNNEKYKDHFDVIRKFRFIKNAEGAPCTGMLKKYLRYQFQQPDDINIFGYTIEEKSRLSKLLKSEPGLEVDDILRENNLTKTACLEIVQTLGIELPVMYKQGYVHNNCIGCPKGGKGYWNHIRIDFPPEFWEMAKIERELNFSCIREKKKKIFLDELDPYCGDFKKDQPGACGFVCQSFNRKLKKVV